jgi:hypothetical protein
VGAEKGWNVGEVVEFLGGPVARLYRRSLTDQGFEVLMAAVFDIAARQGYVVACTIRAAAREWLVAAKAAR